MNAQIFYSYRDKNEWIQIISLSLSIHNKLKNIIYKFLIPLVQNILNTYYFLWVYVCIDSI